MDVLWGKLGNLSTVRCSASLGLSNPASLGVSLWLGPCAALGALVGRPIADRLNQRWFELIALALTFGAALLMIR